MRKRINEITHIFKWVFVLVILVSMSVMVSCDTSKKSDECDPTPPTYVIKKYLDKNETRLREAYTDRLYKYDVLDVTFSSRNSDGECIYRVKVGVKNKLGNKVLEEFTSTVWLK